ncbi:helix-turn-helix transcriptional regulator [Streptomyces sp. PKU-MA01144]|uniref:helix-turn-helix transcriptional regulator n=1 Tax=Streptomyces sp. PKU-MA01144 TaxID=2729138 RepID=UPI00147DEF57|nr:helix-turn-helix transcriptional regulator [Streptomyces sp. PKU-MA01144]NNJ05880.1 helix-turn-helix transcriptional regulator [Streptomyces sp. PKU-MA01144]
MDADNAFGDFLMSRRARVAPAAVGLTGHGRRRVPGLRREEVAELAGVSVVYYTRLEQGRALHPSGAVLDALARVLRLDATERAHLYDLVLRTRTRARSSAGAAAGTGEPVADEPVRDGLRRLVTAVGAVPAYVLSPAMDVLDANDLARALVGAPGPASGGRLNLARHVFADPAARELYPQWEDVARQTVGFLRFSGGRRPGDLPLARLVAELSRHSAEFRSLWAMREVREKSYGTKSFRHPVVGTFPLTYETLTLPGDEQRSLVVFTAPDARAEAALRLLGSWTAPAPAGARTGNTGHGSAG